MLNSNLDLDIKEYVCVDWAAVVEVIDDLGGLDLNITQGEMNQINKYKKDVDGVTGKNTPNVTQYGLVHLDGTQATTYARTENFPEMILNVHPVRELCCRQCWRKQRKQIRQHLSKSVTVW